MKQVFMYQFFFKCYIVHNPKDATNDKRQNAQKKLPKKIILITDSNSRPKSEHRQKKTQNAKKFKLIK